jgi:hypothetical protein
MLRKTLQVKLKNTPTDAPLVCSSVSSVLNREEILSVQDKVLACNTPEVDLLQHTGDQNLRVSDIMYVFVLNVRKFLDAAYFVSELLLKYFFNSVLTVTIFKKGVVVNFSPC